MIARDMTLARAAVGVAKIFNVAFMGLAGTCHQTASKELGVPFIAGILNFRCIHVDTKNPSSEWFADLDYNASGELMITKYVEAVFVYPVPSS